MTIKVAKIHIYQQLNLKNKLSKQEQKIMDMENVSMVARYEECIGEWVKM